MRGSHELFTGSFSQVESIPDRSRWTETYLKTWVPPSFENHMSRRNALRLMLLGTGSALFTACAPGASKHLDLKAAKPQVHELDPGSLPGNFVIAVGTRELYFVSANGTTSRTEPLLGGQQVYDVAAYHNDGSLLLAAGWDDKPGVSNIYTFSGGQIKPLTEGESWDRFPAPAYDGNKVIFVSNRENTDPNNPSVFLKDVTSGEIKKIDLPVTPVWGPVAMSGASVYVTTPGAMIDGEPDLEIVQITTLLNSEPTVVPLTSNLTDDYFLRPNPQGYGLAYLTKDGLIHLMQVFYSSPQREDQIIGGGVITHPIWSPDGRYIAYVASNQINVVEPNTGDYLFRTIDELAGQNMVIKPENISSLAWIPSSP